MKRIIRLTEGDLHRVIKESVNNILIQEGFMDKMRGAYNGFQQGNQQMQNTQSQLNNISQSYQNSQNKLRNTRIAADNSLNDCTAYATNDVNNAMTSLQNNDVNSAYKYLQDCAKYLKYIESGLKEIATEN
jgi:hypothetical protein